MLWAFIIALIVFIIYNIYKEQKEDLGPGVENNGGMLLKYSSLLNYFTQHHAGKITKCTSSRVIIRSSTMIVYIDYVTGDTEVLINAELPTLSKFSKRWKFPNWYPQDKMIEEIENFLEWKMDGFNKTIKNIRSNHKELKQSASLFSTGVSDNQPVKEETIYKVVLTVEEFLAQTGAKGIEVKADPKSINEKTGKNNLFMVYGEQIGAVSTKIQQKFYEEGIGPDNPMIGMSEDKNGKRHFTLFNESDESCSHCFNI